jgi:hypothetical protein
VDADEADDGHGEVDLEGDGDAHVESVMDGTVRLPVGRGTTARVLLPLRSESSAALAVLETIDSEAAVTSWVKLAGPLVLVAVGFSCLVDHWRRCW